MAKEKPMEDLLKASPCACLYVRRADRQLSQLYDRCLRLVGIRSTQYGMLFCVAELPEPYISDIGRILNMDQTTVTRNVEKLEKLGLVTSRPHPGDPRKKMVQLSPSGAAKLDEARPLWEAAQKRVLEYMGEEDYASLLRLLNKLMEAAKN